VGGVGMIKGIIIDDFRGIDHVELEANAINIICLRKRC